MSDYRYVSCPYCGKKSTGKYRIDMSNIQTTRVTCASSSCRQRYTVIHGNFSIETTK